MKPVQNLALIVVLVVSACFPSLGQRRSTPDEQMKAAQDTKAFFENRKHGQYPTLDEREDAAAKDRWAKEKTAIEEREQKQAAERQEREEKARAEAAADEKRLAQLRDNPGARRFVWSSILCFWQELRKDRQNEARKEKKYGKEFGAVNLKKLYSYREVAELADKQIEAAHDALREMKMKPHSCQSHDVHMITACIDADPDVPEGCVDGIAGDALDLAYDLDPALRDPLVRGYE